MIPLSVALAMNKKNQDKQKQAHIFEICLILNIACNGCLVIFMKETVRIYNKYCFYVWNIM